MADTRGAGKGDEEDQSCCKGCFKAELCSCTAAAPPHPLNAAESGEAEGAGGRGLAGEESPLLMLSLLLISMERSRTRPWVAGRVRQMSSSHRRQVTPSFIPSTFWPQ